MSGRAIKAKCWIITTIKAEADIRGQVKYDSADCKITEGENALSVLADERQTGEKWMDEAVVCGREDNLRMSLVIATCTRWQLTAIAHQVLI